MRKVQKALVLRVVREATVNHSLDELVDLHIARKKNTARSDLRHRQKPSQKKRAAHLNDEKKEALRMAREIFDELGYLPTSKKWLMDHGYGDFVTKAEEAFGSIQKATHTCRIYLWTIDKGGEKNEST